MIELDHHLIVAYLFITKCVFAAVDRADKKVDRSELAQPLGGGAMAETLCQQHFQYLAVLDGRGVVCKARVQWQILEPENRAQLAQRIQTEGTDHTRTCPTVPEVMSVSAGQTTGNIDLKSLRALFPTASRIGSSLVDRDPEVYDRRVQLRALLLGGTIRIRFMSNSTLRMLSSEAYITARFPWQLRYKVLADLDIRRHRAADAYLSLDNIFKAIAMRRHDTLEKRELDRGVVFVRGLNGLARLDQDVRCDGDLEASSAYQAVPRRSGSRCSVARPGPPGSVWRAELLRRLQPCEGCIRSDGGIGVAKRKRGRSGRSLNASGLRFECLSFFRGPISLPSCLSSNGEQRHGNVQKDTADA
jgi:hypothetical protein